jgi:hypothetical protein
MRKTMNKHWHYLEHDMTRRIEIYNRELAEARHDQQLIKQRSQAVLKAVWHFTSRGVKVMTGLMRRKIPNTVKRQKRSL